MKLPLNLFAFRTTSPAGVDRLRLVQVWRPTRKPKPRVERQRKPLVRFAWQCGERGGFVAARSRCDARSLIKHELGLPIKRRLPIGTTIVPLPLGK